MKHSFLSLLLLLALGLNAQPVLRVKWTLVSNNYDAGQMVTHWQITNLSDETLTSTGGWKIGYCQMSARPLGFLLSEQQLVEKEVCATYHELTPSPAFRSLAPGESRIFELVQKGTVRRLSSHPEGLFFVSADGQTHPIEVETFVFKEQGMEHTEGYATGRWLFDYNEPFCKPLPDRQLADGTTASWVRPLNLVPCPKEVVLTKGEANLQASVARKTNKAIAAEGYRLTLSKRKITIEASDEAGFFYGEQTLERLRENGEALPAMQISDAPDLAHRGFMLDIVRNYLPKEEVERLLLAMSAYKLNVLHFHIADDEAWRVEIPGLPELTEIGSRRGYSPNESTCLYPAYCGGADPEAATTANGYLTRKDYIHLVRFADSLHIRVLPEVDMPGHSRAAIRSMEARYNRLMQEGRQEEAEQYRLIDPDDRSIYSSAQYYTDNVLCIARPSTYSFVEKVIGELAEMHKEAGQPLKQMHLGGDEVPKGAWELSPLCRQLMDEEGLKDTHELKDYFLSRVLDYLEPRGIQPAGWEELALRGNEVNPKFAHRNVLSWCWNSIPEWKGDEKPYRLCNAGYPVVLACVGNLYIDMCYTNHQEERGLHWGGYTDEHSTFDFLPYDIYRSVRLTLKRKPRDLKVYDREKTVRLQPSARQNIRGINGQLFSETIRSAQQAEEYIFPKLPGLAERAWNATPISYRRAETAIGNMVNALQQGREAFEVERLQYSLQLYQYELPRLKQWGLHFHLPAPGIIVKKAEPTEASVRAFREADKKVVVINCPIPNATVRYTTDGSEPTAESPIYTAPFPVRERQKISAKVFYLGAESATSRL